MIVCVIILVTLLLVTISIGGRKAFEKIHLIEGLRFTDTNNIFSRIEKIEEQIKGNLFIRSEDVVVCETCGCLLNEETAIRGPGEIRKLPTRADFLGTIWAYEDGIYYPWYCKVHGPKPKTNKKNQNIGHLIT